MSKPKALIGGNWKCNGTVEQVKAMIEILNNAGPLSPNSEVVIAAPSIHLGACLASFRPEIAACAEVNNMYQNFFLFFLTMFFTGCWFQIWLWCVYW